MASGKAYKSRIKKVDFDKFDLYQSGDLSEADRKQITVLRNNVNKQIRKAYAENPDNPAFDDLRHAIYVLTKTEPIDAPTIPSVKNMTANKASDLLDIINFSQAEFYKTGEGNIGLNVFFENLEEGRQNHGMLPLAEEHKLRFANIFRSDQWEKLKERGDLGSDQVKNEVEKMLESALDYSSADIIRILDDFLKTGKTNLVGYIDDEIYQRKHPQRSG